MCSFCYRQHCLLNGAATGPSAAGSTKVAVAAAAPVVTGAAAPAAACTETSAKANYSAAETAAPDAYSSSKNPEAEIKTAPKNRCAAAACKKVGLTGFARRCGATYCGTHRYPEKHACGFDFKGAGRDAIARANPLVKGDKLTDKI